MEIILKEDVIGLGYKNDIVNVKPGYGRNYLIPQGKGVIASDSAKKVLAEELKQKAVKLAKIKADAEALAEKLNAVSLTIKAKVSNTGVIYGSVNSLQIADELQKLGFNIDRKVIVVKDVKTAGEYVAAVKLHKEVTAQVPFIVVAEKEIATAPAQEDAPAEKKAKKAKEETPVVEEAPAVEEAPVVEEAPATEEAPVEEAPVEEEKTEE
ncbi:MAG: 50S ribosomal protein L9 [Bacteroidaceae bacterium]|nr:50S ribosomal protein L9 [Bacteroidaceae bacterium]